MPPYMTMWGFVSYTRHTLHIRKNDTGEQQSNPLFLSLGSLLRDIKQFYMVEESVCPEFLVCIGWKSSNPYLNRSKWKGIFTFTLWLLYTGLGCLHILHPQTGWNGDCPSVAKPYKQYFSGKQTLILLPASNYVFQNHYVTKSFQNVGAAKQHLKYTSKNPSRQWCTRHTHRAL